MKYDVLRRHIGDKFYEEGDEREANESDVVHLVKSGVLRPVGEKPAAAPNNKAEKAAPKKKGEG